MSGPRARVLVALLAGACATPVDTGNDAGGVDAGRDVGASDARAAGDADTAHDATSGDGGACATPDQDHDGASSVACGGTDCDDSDPNRFPGNPEVCDAAGHDEDCNATTFGSRDADLDGHVDAACCNTDTAGAMHCGDDCDDTRIGVHPDAPEVCNALDDDCDTAIDEGVLIPFYADCDGDGIGAGAAMPACSPTSCMSHPAVTANGDCDDGSPSINPGAPEVCDGVDNDCDTSIDEGVLIPFYADCDGDLHGASTPMPLCAPSSCGGHPAVLNHDDCDDTSPGIHPGAGEVCNGLDDDCNALVDDGALCSVMHGTSTCSMGACTASTCDAGYHACGTACVDSSSLLTCGTSCTPCVSPAHGSATCDAVTGCAFTCTAGYAVEGAGCDVGPPRAIAPLSTSTVTSRRPTLRWSLFPGTDGAHVDICRDRACTMIVTTIDVTGSSTVPTADLPPGVLFWRLFGRIGTSVGLDPGPTWELVVGARTAPVDTSWGTMLDVNGDGYPDLAVGAQGVSSQTGRAYVYLGTGSGLDTAAPVTLIGPDGAGGDFGRSVASAGDLNGDGYADLVVGAESVAFYTGRAYVYYGSASGVGTVPSVTLTGPDGANGYFGYAVAGAGDLNGDGYADLAVGAYGASSNTGRVYVFQGSGSGLVTSPAATLAGPGGANGNFGSAVASAGDVNGDGYADLAVGAYAVNAGTLNGGRTYLYRGSAFGVGGAPGTLDGGAPPGGDSFFGSSVASAGDANGDGYADLAVGAPTSGSLAGYTFVFYGSAGGPRSIPDLMLFPPDGANGEFGSLVTSAGDVNGDGYADLAVGAPLVMSSTGRAYLYLGGAAGLGTSPVTTLTGPDGANGSFGFAIRSASDVNGDGYMDLAVGAWGASSYAGQAYVYLGSASGLGPSALVTLTGPDGANGEFGVSVF